MQHPLLQEANKIIDENPDSALLFLKKINLSQLKNENQRMYRRLLIIKATDKAYISPKDDKEIKDVMNYFIQHPETKDIYPEVYYYAGRTYRELREDGKALAFFNKALRELRDKPNPKLENCIHSQLSALYSTHGLIRHSLDEVKKYVRLTDSVYNKKNDESHKHRIGARLSLAAFYRQARFIDSGLYVYKELEPEIARLNDSILTTTYYTQLALTYLYGNYYAEADSIINLSPRVVDRASLPSVESIFNLFALRLDKSKINEKTTEELLSNPILELQYQAALTLAKIAQDRNDGEMLLKYARKIFEINEKIQKEYNENSLAEMEEIIDHARLENENLLLTLSNQRKEQWLTILILSSLLLIAIIAGLYIRSRFKQVKGNLEIERLKNENSRQIRELEDKINILNKKISDSDQVGEIDSERRKADELKKNLDLAKITERIMNSLTSRGAKITDTDLLNLRKCISGRYPGFLQTLLDMGVSNDNIVDAMFIKINVPQKMCAAYFRITSSGISNSRRRLFDKHCADTGFKNWKDFILSLGEKKD
ncbi:MAG: hypothetical protein K2G90_01235 [Muribaculaceae bacterium]|nr:hypothetical protein [Muribaculaceae bacterium]